MPLNTQNFWLLLLNRPCPGLAPYMPLVLMYGSLIQPNLTSNATSNIGLALNLNQGPISSSQFYIWVQVFQVLLCTPDLSIKKEVAELRTLPFMVYIAHIEDETAVKTAKTLL